MSLQDVAARNRFDLSNWAPFWERIQREWAEMFKRITYYDFDDDPDHYTCPYCGLVGSCMCEDILQEELDPEGLGLEEDYDY
jgi:hypothetical protein